MRRSGLLLHLSSLPSPYGIGAMGRAGVEFVDFLAAAGQTYWQLLPVCPTSLGDSPYQTFSTFAGNPYFIDLDELAEEGLLHPEEYRALNWGEDARSVDYAQLYRRRYPVLRTACTRLARRYPGEFERFCQENQDWLDDYALFMALKDAHGGCSWQEWEEPLRRRDAGALERAAQERESDLLFWKLVQYLFFLQWGRLKTYANEKGILIIGDLPIYVAMDSADVWAGPHLYQLDGNLRPVEVAGCPPDGFSSLGQLWGNPLYNWEVMKQSGYDWWARRVQAMTRLYDLVRIDHFRGLESYYAIPASAPDARQGRWRQGPGMDFFTALESRLGRLPIIAEDLGFLTPAVKALLEDSGYPGMKVLQFAFDSREDSDYLPHNYPRRCVVYTGTHDNDTALGWFRSAPRADAAFAKEYMRLDAREGYNWGMIRAALASVGDTVILQMQDLLDLGSEARMNVPSTIGSNWRWRMLEGEASGELAARLRRLTQLYGRLPPQGAERSNP